MRQPLRVSASSSTTAAGTGALAGVAAAAPAPPADMINSISACSAATRPLSMGCLAWVAASISRIMSPERSSVSTNPESTWRLPPRIWSSSVSSVCVNAATSVKPKVALPPLMECATRKIVLTRSRSASPAESLSSAASIESSASLLSAKNVSWNCVRSSVMGAGLAGELEQRADVQHPDGFLERRGARLPHVGQAALEAIEREGQHQLHAGGVHLLHAAAVDFAGTGPVELLEQMRLQCTGAVNGAVGGQHDAPVRRFSGRTHGNGDLRDLFFNFLFRQGPRRS